jgi:flagellar hook assembly protein FlgD
VQLRYELATAGLARLSVYDLRGRVVRRLIDGTLPAGAGSILWDGTDAGGAPAASGVYTVVLEAEGQRSSQKATLIR